MSGPPRIFRLAKFLALAGVLLLASVASAAAIESMLVECRTQLEMWRSDRVTPGLAEKAMLMECPDPYARVMPVMKSSPRLPSSGGHDGGGPAASDGETWRLEQERQENERLEREKREREAFERSKQELLGSVKGGGASASGLRIKTPATAGQGLPLTSGGLPVKSGAQPRASGSLPIKTGAQTPAATASQDAVERKVSAARQRIDELRKDVIGIQVMLRQYVKSLNNNAGDFTAWGETINTAYNGVLDNSKEYVTGLFLEYGLLAGLKSAQKSSFDKLNGLVTSRDPAVKAWLSKELGGRSVDFDRFEKLVKLGAAEGDFAALLTSENGQRKNLDALILISDLLDVADIPAFKSHPFQHARMIGATYADLASICYGWFSINRLEKDTRRLAREADSLSARMRHAMQEMECLDGCVQDYTDRCMERCAGRTRLHSPPPLPR